jgi:hypothetical protein
MVNCKCKELKFTNPYSDSYKCKKCGRLFVVTHNFKLIKEVFPNEIQNYRK